MLKFNFLHKNVSKILPENLKWSWNLVDVGWQNMNIAFMPPWTLSKGLFSYLESFGRLLGSSKLRSFMLSKKKNSQDGFFARKVLKTKWSMYIRLRLHNFAIFCPLMNSLVWIIKCLEVFFALTTRSIVKIQLHGIYWKGVTSIW